MLHNPLLRKLVQISEEALLPIQIPLVLGNDFFILTQQDVRKIEDTRFFILRQVLPNGDLKIINSLDAADCLQRLSQCADSQYQQILNCFWEFLNYKRNASQEYQQQQATLQQTSQQRCAFIESSGPQPMEVSMSADNVASISQQLQWNNCKNILPPFPIHYSHGTSTTEIEYKPEMSARTSMTCNHLKTCKHCKNHRLRWSDKSTSVEDVENACNKKPNEALDAREQLKKKKMTYSFT